MLKRKSSFLILSAAMACFSCTSKPGETEAPPRETAIQTPVTVFQVARGTLDDYAELNATAAYLETNIVKAPANGYIHSVDIAPGQFVPKGKTLFSIQTKEAKNIGAMINDLDSSFRFTGTTQIHASKSGYITQLNHQVGDYVQDGEQLAVVSTSGSFGFILNLPYELKRYVPLNKSVEVLLPDGTSLKGTIVSLMPAVDSVSQTQRILVRVPATVSIPENLIARVRILKTQKKDIIALPKAAILSNESQTLFWVMKMIDSVTAVKVEVSPGIELNGKVEILKPFFNPGDQILVSGNYGLADTAKVKIEKPE